MHEDTQKITDIILKAASKARRETRNESQKRHAGKSLIWPIECTIGPGLEGAIACDSKIGYVDGSKGWLVYRGYDIFDLCAYSSYEEVSYLLLHGTLPNPEQLEVYTKKLVEYRYLNKTLRLLMGFPVEEMNAMGALRMGTILMRQEFTYKDQEAGRPDFYDAISADEDSIPMETMPTCEKKSIYEFSAAKKAKTQKDAGGCQWAGGLLPSACWGTNYYRGHFQGPSGTHGD
jgi:citrate synthase